MVHFNFLLCALLLSLVVLSATSQGQGRFLRDRVMDLVEERKDESPPPSLGDSNLDGRNNDSARWMLESPTPAPSMANCPGLVGWGITCLGDQYNRCGTIQTALRLYKLGICVKKK
jgi:hypothetical protein